MNTKKILSFFSSLCLINTLLFSESPCPSDQELCGLSCPAQRVGIRHIESNGIGYNDGYTTLEGFFTYDIPSVTSWLPFLDVRGHIFNDGKVAANLGLGARYLTSRVWGFSAFYDYRRDHNTNYNQLSVGLESLGKIWDFRINGYLPLGRTKSHFYHTRFHAFTGNQMIISQKRQFALKGFNAELGAHIKKYKNFVLYGAIGPYYFEAENERSWGGQGRLFLKAFEYVTLQLSGSYDRIFKGVVQGEVGLTYRFGEKKEIKRRTCCDCEQGSYSCKKELVVRERALQKVDRFEIIALDQKRKHTIAINPVTGQPYFFWFVDNTSHSLGTFESPFNMLLAAQMASSINDVIYLFPGDGTSTGMNQGITLKDSQKLFGAGRAQILPTTKGSITIPALAKSLPVITNSVNGVINCANNNEISGLFITLTDIQGIVCSNVVNTSIHDNFIDMHNDGAIFTPSIGVIFSSSGGQLTVNNNRFNYDENYNHGIDVFSTSGEETYLFTNNLFIAPSLSNSALGIGLGQPSIGNFSALTISNNQFNNMGILQFEAIGSPALPGGPAKFIGTGNLTISRNNFSGCGQFVIFLELDTTSNMAGNVINNVWVNSQPQSESLSVLNASLFSLTLTGNISDIVSPAVGIAYGLSSDFLAPSAAINAEISNNIGVLTID